MAWFKVDDGFHSSRKLMQIPRSLRIEAAGLWVISGSWSAQEELDGLVPNFMLEEWGAKRESIEWLVKVELWETYSDGTRFANWGEYQPTKAELEENRQKERDRKAAWRAEKARRDAERKFNASQGDTHGTDASVPAESPLTRPGPTRPGPTPLEEAKASSSSEIAKAIRPDVEALLDLLDSELQANDVKKLPVRNKANLDAMRLLIDKDGYGADQVARIIRWCQADSFWRGNVMSATKLREQFETLRAHANRKREERMQAAPTKSEKAHDFINELIGGGSDGSSAPEARGGRDGVGPYLELRQ